MEQDIHIEDLQESVMQYARMRSKIEETMNEIQKLQDIRAKYDAFQEKEKEVQQCTYQIDRLEMLKLSGQIEICIAKEKVRQEGTGKQEETLALLKQEESDLQKQYEEIILRIANSGYANLEAELTAVNETLEHLQASQGKWQQTAERLNAWKEQDIASNQMLWNIEKFTKGTITAEELERLQESFGEVKEELEEQRQEAQMSLRKIKKEEKESREELKELKQGKKAYPKELEEARYELRNRLHDTCKTFVNVQILADLLDVKDETWHNAIEGYLGNNKLLLVVEPAYAKEAMRLYEQMDRKKYHRVSILDTEKVKAGAGENGYAVKENALAKEVKAREDYVQDYIDFFLGNVEKCDSVEELRDCKIGVTPDCVLYHSFRLQHMNPDQYTRRAYIGETSMRQRVRQLEARCEKLQEERMPLQELLEEIKATMQLEMLSQPAEDYLDMQAESAKIKDREKRKKQLLTQMQQMKEESVDAWEREKEDIRKRQDDKKAQITEVQEAIWKQTQEIRQFQEERLQAEEALKLQRQKLENGNWEEAYEQNFQEYLAGKRSENYEYLQKQKLAARYPKIDEREEAYQKLVEERSSYLRSYANRTFSAVSKDNEAYDKLLNELTCEELETFKDAAQDQARTAVEHFKDDFIFKIRSAIREAYQRQDELNRIISKLDFGKDKYQFVITKNKGPDGKYYKMFMDDSLKIHPATLSDDMENQLNLFTMEHEEQYADLMDELISIFLPPENATPEELEEAKKNMDKYADYRTYLSFDMQQIVHGEKEMKIGLSKMIKKNSGGEGQNPLYVALLASFAQLYRIHMTPKMHRNPTIRLVVLDEAFSKMDAEKVASCISLIRGLGFQAIISATNDKIQNYLENVDKTFVYANPNKRHISIQEFEKCDFSELIEE